jgi:NSS family neurotransmitter:Na+ symporter
VLPILFGILLLLVFSAFRMEGSGEAIAFLFRPSFGELEPGGLLEALGHSFFTLSLGMGAMITYGSYLDADQSVVKTSAIVVLLDTVIALIACVIMFSVIFSVPGMEEQIGASTVGMLFISLPELFYSEVPFGVVLGPLFYVLVALAALTSTISLLEVVCSYLIDQHDVGRPRATLLAGSTVFLFTILAALSFGSVSGLSTFEIFEGKQGWFSTADHFVSNWMLPTGGLAITIAAGWFMTREATRGQLVDGTQPTWFRYSVWRFFIRFMAPAAVAAVIVAVLFFGVDFS